LLADNARIDARIRTQKSAENWRLFAGDSRALVAIRGRNYDE
jgi:hypothetical protein